MPIPDFEAFHGREGAAGPAPEPGAPPAVPSRPALRDAAPAPAGQGEVTRLLRAWHDGDESAFERLFPLVYDELRRTARAFLAGEKRGHTLQATALVHETYFRLVEQHRVAWQERSHFYSIAARLMRRVLVDHARSRDAVKRGRHHPRLPLEQAGPVTLERPADLLALDDALASLAQIDRRKAALVELRFFAGLSLEETAEVLGCSRPTVVRQWQVARAWLYDALRGDREPGAERADGP